MLKIISKIPAYYFFRLLDWPRKLPLNLTLSLSFRCNSRCKTCNIHQKKSDELSSNEWEKIFKRYGKELFWVTISGGEPFLRDDIFEIVKALFDNCHPAVINIPTNAVLNEKVSRIVKQIVDYCKKSQIVINISIDEIGERHDAIRGAPGSYEKALQTFRALKSITNQNLSVGIHSVISAFNVDRIPQIYQHLSELHPDSYITEIAEEREELGSIGSSITPAYLDYSKAIDFLIHKLKKEKFSKIGKLTRALRMEYYQMVKKILLQERQVIPCYAGFASAQIAPNGDIWFCCIKAQAIGNLRDTGFDFRKVWFSEKAYTLRKSIKNRECFCPLANASYTNMLHNFQSLTRIAWNLVNMS